MTRKKKGSSMIAVVLVMAIIFTLGTAMLTLTASNYKNTINESKRIQNLYQSDSNLDLVYNLILKSSQAAIVNANEKMISKYNNEINDELNSKINNEFKEEFINYLNDKKTNNTPVIKYAIENGQYLKIVETEEEKKIDDSKNKILIDIGYDIGSEIKIYDYSCINNTIEFVVESTFETVDKNTTLSNRKTVSTKFTINAPDFIGLKVDEVINKTIDIYPVFNGKVITADGDMSVNSTVDIKGDVWVKGRGELGSNPAYAFDKYNGGILVDGGTLNISKGNLLTSQTLTLRNKSTVQAENIYALNTYIGPQKSGADSGENKLTVTEDLVTNNDLAINSNKSEVNLKNYFGINEYTISSVIDPEIAARESSSIIINNENSKMKISNDAYIMGVAYIDTDQKYRTGESVAVKGNYLAYTEIIPGYEDKVTLKYYNPLQLIESIDNDSSASKKGEYFTKYYKGKTAKTGGINLNKVYSVGAYINQDGTVTNISNVQDNSEVKNKRNEFARTVLSMGLVDKNTIESLYKNNIVVKTVANQIDFTKIDAEYQKKVNNQYGSLILINNKEKTVIDKETDALIISNGDVEISGGAKFTGNIITTGDVIVKGKAELNYDDEITSKIIASNYELINQLFTNSEAIMQKEVKYNKTTTESQLYDYGNEFIKTSGWKIVKKSEAK